MRPKFKIPARSTIPNGYPYAMQSSTDRRATSPFGPESLRLVRCRACAALARTACCPVAPDGRAHGAVDATDALLLNRCRTQICTPVAMEQRLLFVREARLYLTWRASGSDARASAVDAAARDAWRAARRTPAVPARQLPPCPMIDERPLRLDPMSNMPWRSSPAKSVRSGSGSSAAKYPPPRASHPRRTSKIDPAGQTLQALRLPGCRNRSTPPCCWPSRPRPAHHHLPRML
jgi:hypothetical protein